MISQLKKLVPYVAKPVLSKIHRFKDVYKGQSCYIFGDGISIKWFDLRSFADKPAITLSFLPFHNQFECLRVEHAIVSGPYWFYPIQRTTTPPFRRHINGIQRTYRKKAIAKYPDITFFVNLANYPVLWNKNVQFVFQNLYDERLSPEFLCNRVNCYTGSLRTAILLAVYLGCDRAFLVGCDYTHVPARILHWYEKGHGLFQEHPGYQKEFFDIAKEFIDITTITLDGKSDLLDYVTYRDYTGCAPVFKENTELAEERHLRVLSTWPGYTIF